MSDIESPNASATCLLAGYVPEQDVAATLGRGLRALRAMRQRGEGPPWVKVSKRVYYPEAGFREWLKSIEQRPVRARKAA